MNQSQADQAPPNSGDELMDELMDDGSISLSSIDQSCSTNRKRKFELIESIESVESVETKRRKIQSLVSVEIFSTPEFNTEKPSSFELLLNQLKISFDLEKSEIYFIKYGFIGIEIDKFKDKNNWELLPDEISVVKFNPLKFLNILIINEKMMWQNNLQLIKPIKKPKTFIVRVDGEEKEIIANHFNQLIFQIKEEFGLPILKILHLKIYLSKNRSKSFDCWGSIISMYKNYSSSRVSTLFDLYSRKPDDEIVCLKKPKSNYTSFKCFFESNLTSQFGVDFQNRFYEKIDQSVAFVSIFMCWCSRFVNFLVLKRLEEIENEKKLVEVSVDKLQQQQQQQQQLQQQQQQMDNFKTDEKLNKVLIGDLNFKDLNWCSILISRYNEFKSEFPIAKPEPNFDFKVSDSINYEFIKYQTNFLNSIKFAFGPRLRKYFQCLLRNNKLSGKFSIRKIVKAVSTGYLIQEDVENFDQVINWINEIRSILELPACNVLVERPKKSTTQISHSWKISHSWNVLRLYKFILVYLKNNNNGKYLFSLMPECKIKPKFIDLPFNANSTLYNITNSIWKSIDDDDIKGKVGSLLRIWADTESTDCNYSSYQCLITLFPSIQNKTKYKLKKISTNGLVLSIMADKDLVWKKEKHQHQHQDQQSIKQNIQRFPKINLRQSINIRNAIKNAGELKDFESYVNFNKQFNHPRFVKQMTSTNILPVGKWKSKELCSIKLSNTPIFQRNKMKMEKEKEKEKQTNIYNYLALDPGRVNLAVVVRGKFKANQSMKSNQSMESEMRKRKTKQSKKMPVEKPLDHSITIDNQQSKSTESFKSSDSKQQQTSVKSKSVKLSVDSKPQQTSVKSKSKSISQLDNSPRNNIQIESVYKLTRNNYIQLTSRKSRIRLFNSLNEPLQESNNELALIKKDTSTLIGYCEYLKQLDKTWYLRLMLANRNINKYLEFENDRKKRSVMAQYFTNLRIRSESKTKSKIPLIVKQFDPISNHYQLFKHNNRFRFSNRTYYRPEETTVFYGDKISKVNYKGAPTTPSTSLYKQCKSQFINTIPTDEYFTSQKCFSCTNQLKIIKIKLPLDDLSTSSGTSIENGAVGNGIKMDLCATSAIDDDQKDSSSVTISSDHSKTTLTSHSSTTTTTTRKHRIIQSRDWLYCSNKSCQEFFNSTQFTEPRSLNCKSSTDETQSKSYVEQVNQAISNFCLKNKQTLVPRDEVAACNILARGLSIKTNSTFSSYLNPLSKTSQSTLKKKDNKKKAIQKNEEMEDTNEEQPSIPETLSKQPKPSILINIDGEILSEISS